jgi:nuclear pore complex protein Nup107
MKQIWIWVGDWTKTTVEDLERWEQEVDTWELLRRLLQVRFLQHEPQQSLPNRYSSEREIWDQFIQSDLLALERKTVLDWLKDTADDSGEEIDILVQGLQENADRGDILAYGWLHTKAAIKNQKRIHVWPQVLDPSSPEVQKVLVSSDRVKKLVTQLDPDAPTRQSRQLEASDEYFERAIWLGCYEMLRRGRTGQEIREWCRARTEIWRAVSMSGLPDTDTEDDDETNDPRSSLLWRRMCYALTRRHGVDEYERAVYGILGGDLESVNSVARGWDDLMFAHYNALLRTQFDAHLRDNYPDRAPPDVFHNLAGFDAQQYHGDVATTSQRLVDTLKSHVLSRDEAKQPMKMLQGVLIADQFDNFMYQQGLALAKFANREGRSKLIPKLKASPENEDVNTYITLEDQDGLRVLTHMYLIYKTLGLELGKGERVIAIENIVAAYISFLRFAGKEEFIPLYSAQLSGDRVYATLSRTLVDMNDPDQRLTLIGLIKGLGLDVQKFVRYQTSFLLQDNEETAVQGYPAKEKFSILQVDEKAPDSGYSISPEFIGTTIDRVDVLLIRSLEWHLLVDGLWSEVFKAGTFLYQRFYSMYHYSSKHELALIFLTENCNLAAALLLSQKLHSSEISRHKTHGILDESLSLEELREDCEINEALDPDSEGIRILKRHMLAEANNFVELQTLTETLDNLESFASFQILLAE